MSKSQSSRISAIGKKNFSSTAYSIDSDNDEDDELGDGYLIDPSIQMWKSIDFKRVLSEREEQGKEKPQKSGKELKPKLSHKQSRAIVGAVATETSANDDDLPILTTASSDVLSRNNKVSDISKRAIPTGTSGNISSVNVPPPSTAETVPDLCSSASSLSALSVNSGAPVVSQVSQVSKERDDLKNALEEMMRENARLKREMELSKQESSQILEREREERQSIIYSMEERHRQMTHKLLVTQNDTEIKLQKERDELRHALVRMSREKDHMEELIQQNENKAREAAMQLEAQREELRLHVAHLAQEKEDMVKLIEASAENVKKGDKAAQEMFAREKAAMQARIHEMEKEKKNLADGLVSSEKKLKEEAAALAAMIEQERLELGETMQRIAREKEELARHLAMTEQRAKEDAQQLRQQLEREKAEVVQSIRKVELEKADVTEKLRENMAEELRKASLQAREDVMRERAELEKRIQEIAEEKKKLADQLRDSEHAAAERERLVGERLASERDELKSAVQRMKMELAAEREAAAKAAALAAAEAAASAAASKEMALSRGNSDPNLFAAATSSPSPQAVAAMADSNTAQSSPTPVSVGALPIKQAKSLFDLMEEGDSGPQSQRGQARKMGMHGMATIPESRREVEKCDENGEGSELDEDEEDEEDQFAELPAPHAAAAKGDVSKLEMLASLELSLLSSFDDSKRSPLFYAVAYGKASVAEFLLERADRQLLIEAEDIHGDTPLHAAVSGGNAACVSLLLERISSEGSSMNPYDEGDGNKESTKPNRDNNSHTLKMANYKNKKGLTPSHMASTVECLELLFSYGATLSDVDNEGRSPLFVACALNRVDCAEFIVNCLDLTETSLLIQDNRGDTPLHASACNGSVDCLLLLLQFGVDPRVTNSSGLKAVDLAVKNRQKKCRQLLAEYHLHFCTSSDFDSVLFLAALEGHKQARNNDTRAAAPGAGGAPGQGSEGEYKIIRKVGSSNEISSVTTSAGSSANNLLRLGLGSGSSSLNVLSRAGSNATMSRGKSLFSLKHDRSLRMVKYGAWIAYEDQHTGQIYWYNHVNSTGQWEQPPEVSKLQPTKSVRSLGSQKSLVAKKSMRLKKFGDWIQYISDGGKEFYYNDKTGEFQWTRPNDPYTKIGAKLTENLRSGGVQNANTSDDAITSSSSPFDDDDGGIIANDPKLKDWRAYKDPGSGAIFWYNVATNVSQWQCPLDTAGVRYAIDQRGNTYVTSDRLEDGADEAVEVFNEEDLGI